MVALYGMWIAMACGKGTCEQIVYQLKQIISWKLGEKMQAEVMRF